MPGGNAGLDPTRAAEVITTRASGGIGRGSGYLVAGRLVMTAAHVLADATAVQVRFNADRPGEWSAHTETVWWHSAVDIAILCIVEDSVTPPDATASEVTPVRFGRIARPPVPIEALGFPLFKIRQRPWTPGRGGSPSRYRDSHHATGTATSWSNRREGTMAIDVLAPERDPAGRSPWEGMAGAAVFSGDYLIGVIGEHHRGDGLDTLAAYRIDHWYAQLDDDRLAELAVLIGLPATSELLACVTALEEPPRIGLPRQLPATTSAFTGRKEELTRLLALAEAGRTGGSSSAVVISAIDGMAGIGKTALAIHAGQRLAAHFPDGQLFLDLHGYTKGMNPREPADALAVILRAYGVPPAQIPPELDERAALYRDRLAGTRTLVVLDNAATEAQVRPLLPGDGGCLVLVTSRKRLKALDDAHILSLDVLPTADAVSLVREAAGPGRITADDSPLLEEIVALCGRLPLALRIAGALIRHRDSWSLGHLADRLRESRPGLERFSDGDRDLIAVFEVSYRTLGENQQLLFSRLGLIPGPDVDAYATAVLLDLGLDEAESLLQDLEDHNLLTESAQGRYRMHDLVRLYAHNLAGQSPAAQRDAATERLLDYYEHTARRADARIARHTRPVPVGLVPANAPDLPDPDTARAWLRAERANLMAVIEFAAQEARHERVVALSAGLAALLRIDGPWVQALAVHTAALTAAEDAGDRPGRADALAELGGVRYLTGDLPGAMRDLEAALELSRDLGDRLGQANARTELGTVRYLTGDLPGAMRDLETAFELSRDLGDRLGQANALTELGVARRVISDGSGAKRDLEAAVERYRELGDRTGEANALTELGNTRYTTGDLPGAMRDLEAALDLCRDLGDRPAQAYALTELGSVRHLSGDLAGAMRDLAAALDLCRDLGDRLVEVYALAHLGAVRYLAGDEPGAEQDLHDALELCRSLGDRTGEGLVLHTRGVGRRAAGRLPEAIQDLEETLEISRRIGSDGNEAITLTDLGLVRRLAGDLPGATRDLEAALVLYRRLGLADGEAWVLNQYAPVFIAAGDADRAMELYGDALRLARAADSAEQQASALEGIGKCHLLGGDVREGARQLNQAREIFLRLAMQSAVERIEARLERLGEP